MLWIILALLIFIIQIAVILCLEYRRPHKAVAWLVIMFLFPWIGFLFYYFVGREYNSIIPSRHKDRQKWAEIRRNLEKRCQEGIAFEQLEQNLGNNGPLLGALKKLVSVPITAFNQTTVFVEGEKTFSAMLESIAAAKHHIHIQFYIIRDDQLGTRFQELLIDKAQQGVKVRFLYDGIGSRSLGKAYLRKLEEGGVETGCFFPPITSFFNKRINYRNHRKLLVVDGQVGYIGGFNIGDEYLGKNSEIGHWRDTMFKLEGDAVLWLQYTFLIDWFYVKQELVGDSLYYPPQKRQGKEWVQIVKSGPDETILELLFTCIVSATKRIYIETPYFIPDTGILLALKTAAIKGVDVRVILPSSPDYRIVYWASMSYIQELMEAGVRFYVYQKGFIHAKVTIIDDMAFSGTANMDIRSFSNQFEINAIFFDGTVVNRLVQDFERDLGVSKEILLSEFAKRPKSQKLMEGFARLLSSFF